MINILFLNLKCLNVFLLQVTTNGYITFGKKQNFPSPQRFPDPPKVAMIAPFWSDLVVERPGRVTYKFYEEDKKSFHTATQLIESYENKKISFGNWILVVTWENVQPSNRMRNLTEVDYFYGVIFRHFFYI